MAKFCVKKPFTVVVAVIMVLVLGVISFMNMTTDLLPTIELPYVVAVTTYPGASPERVETAVTGVLESSFGTVNGVANLSSISSENYSMVILEFESGTNMDSAMVKLSTAVDQIKGYLPETASSPMLLQISPDMLPVMVASVDMEGLDIYELTRFTSEEVVPYFERQAGVASVDGTGLVEQSVEVRLDGAKIEAINDRVLASVHEKLDEAQRELNDAKSKLAGGKADLQSAKDALEDKQAGTTDELAKASAQIDAAVAQASALASQQAALQASKAGLEAEKEGLEQAGAMYDAINGLLPTIGAQVLAGVNEKIGTNFTTYEDLYKEWAASPELQQKLQLPSSLPNSIDEALAMQPQDFAAFKGLMQGIPNTDQISQEKLALVKSAKQKVENGRLDEIATALNNLETELTAAKMMAEEANKGLATAKDYYAQLEAGKIAAAAGFGAGTAQIAATESSLEEAQKQLDDAAEQLNDAREAALENADVTKLLSKDMIANILKAQNFSMPAGYLYEGEGQYLVRVGDAYASVEEMQNTLLFHMDVDGVGDVRLSDVASVTLIDDAADSYAKVNGNQAVVLSISKSSTAGTSDVSKQLNQAIQELEAKYEGLRVTPLMDQGDYIKMIVDSVLSNLAWGGALAVLVLALFLKSMRPTLVVAFSIPISLMFAIVLMYFSGVTLNIISLSGLALGVGMLVDNSIVVIENIYRLRGQGMPAAKAAVQGAGQVAGAIAASTLTTVCVFLPIVFTEGLTRQLFTDMGLTIAYSLCASLLVALTLVPCMGATLLKSEKEKNHPWFDAMVRGYEKVLRFCLKRKAVPLSLSLALLVFAIWQTTRMGMEFMPEMGGNQMSVTMTVPEGMGREDAYKLADEVMQRTMEVEGVEIVGAMSGGGAAMMGMGSSGDEVSSFSFYILLDDEASKDNSRAAKAITEATAGLGAELSISTSNMDMSALGGSGLQLRVTGTDLSDMLAVSEDMMGLLGKVEGFENITNGQEEGDEELHLIINKDAAMRYGLTVAQVYSELAAALTTETSATTLTVGADDFAVTIVDETGKLDQGNLMGYTFETTTQDEDGNTVAETHTLGEFATLQNDKSVASINRENQARYMTVSADTAEGYNTTLLSRQVEKLLEGYQPPEGCAVSIEGETTNIADAMQDLVLMILLAVAFIYLIMVAQFQSLLSPFIVMFTMPLAFTGGLLGLVVAGEPLSIIAMLGFLVLAGVVVNNGIVFVDYANQLWLEGMDKREALVETGKTRMRPILMTALTTILAMCTMVFSTDASAKMTQPLAIVTIGGLSYATLLTLFVVPVLYDLLFRRQPKQVDLGEET